MQKERKRFECERARQVENPKWEPRKKLTITFELHDNLILLYGVQAAILGPITKDLEITN